MRYDVVFVKDDMAGGARVTCYAPEGGRQVEERHETMGWVISDGESEPYSGTAKRLLAESDLWRAAPDLLAACARALGFVDSMPDNDNVGLADCLRAAIAKAEGREP